MSAKGNAKLLYLNRENAWLDFETHGLDLVDGQLRLSSLPLFETTQSEELASLPVPSGPAGIAVSHDGTIYFTDPDRHLLLRIDTCSGETSPTPCLGGYGAQFTQFSTPRGVLFDRRRRALLVADSGNHRVQLFNPETLQLLDIWSGFDRPWSLAADDEGNVYVVDFGNQRVQKFDPLGQVVESFWDSAKDALECTSPTEVAAQGDEVYVLAPSSKKIFVLNTDGQLLRTIEAEALQNAMGLAVKDAIYVGDNNKLRIIKFTLAGIFVGEVRGFHGPVAALAFDSEGQLLVHTGSSDFEILHIASAGGYAKSGFMWGGPFGDTNPLPKEWFRLKAIGDPLATDAHLQLFTFVSDELDDPASVLTPGDDPFAGSAWRPLPPDVTDGLMGWPTKSYIWVGAAFSGEGLSSPSVSQMSVEYDHQGYLGYLPAIYREDPLKREFLQDFLALYESFFDDNEQRIRSLNSLFDPKSAPGEFLSWLAGWLALDLDEHWTEEKKRTAIAQVFDLYSRRGTAEGLRAALRFFLGIEAQIEEPILYASWWALPADSDGENPAFENAMLGFNTTLAPEEAQGAVVGTTATYDESSLITVDEFGAPLFANLAHRFVVRVHRAQAGGPERQQELQRIIDREKPAHTVSHLCLVQPGVRIGLQARLGIDSVLSGELPLGRLGGSSLGEGLVLGGNQAGQLGERSRVGQTTHLGDRGNR
ncbi:MAG TPA: phage tail protein [Pyrinomonadaceae bacterium]|nr:phage tail protein [Pyrinomonadaceae bacterium]